MHITKFSLRRRYEIENDVGEIFLFQAESTQENMKVFPARSCLDESINDLVLASLDGKVLRYLKVSSEQVPEYTGHLNFSAGLAALVVIDTSLTDADRKHKTVSELNVDGISVKSADVYPTTLDNAKSQVRYFTKSLPGTEWIVIKQGNGYLAAEVVSRDVLEFVK